MAIKAFVQWIDHSPGVDDSKIRPYLRITANGNDMGDLETRDYYLLVDDISPAILPTMEAACVSAAVASLGTHGISVGLLDVIIFR